MRGRFHFVNFAGDDRFYKTYELDAHGRCHFDIRPRIVTKSELVDEGGHALPLDFIGAVETDLGELRERRRPHHGLGADLKARHAEGDVLVDTRDVVAYAVRLDAVGARRVRGAGHAFE